MRSRASAALVLAVVALASCGDDPESGEGDDVTIEGVVVEDGQSNEHVDDPTYDAAPPSGGDHIAAWLNCGVYPVPVPDGNAVHSLEHGVVWFAYDAGDDSVDVDALIDLADSQPDRVIVSPYPDLPSPVVAVAWERRLEVDAADDPRLAEFLDAFVNGAQAPEPRAPCDGGVALAD